ncbi:TraM recognition domain-containing protein [Streptacidiphilus cavernicola]|uniref:TraM recognition domain-containing protein n=1 Tax=Streptacidiphilus cavernicola TaxID=3342716 RepID=A0ABV6W2V3_9ACTN
MASSMNGRSWPPATPPGGRQGPPPPRAGIPDGAIVGLLATLLGATALVWFSTALGALLEHGGLPRPLPFSGTPHAIRGLATAPNSMAAAWPDTPPGELPSPTAFWVTFFVLLALLIALALTLLTAWTRLRAAKRGDRDQKRERGWEREREREWSARGGEASADRERPTARQGQGQGADSAGYGAGTGWEQATLPLPRPGGAAPAGAPGTTAPAAPGDPGDPATVTSLSPTAAPSTTTGPFTDPAHTPAPFVTPTTPAPAPAPAPFASALPAPPPAAPQALAPSGFPPGMTVLLMPDPAATAAKRHLLQRAVRTATGPVLVVTDDLALWEARPPHRDARLFDPLRLVDEVPDPETRVRWAPHDHCDDPATAAARARALLAPTHRGGPADAQSSGERGVRETAQTLLRCWLHAAALDGRPFRHVQRWASGSGRGEALAILRSADPHRAADGWDGELQALLTHATEQRDAAVDRILDALDVLSELQVQQACAPSSAAEGLDLDALLHNRGTLYLLGRASESRVARSTGTAQAPRSAMPLLTALVEDLVERARRTAVRSSAGRLDPPLLCVLDQVAAVAPFPGLPELVARGGPLGLGGVAVLRSAEQARSRWDERSVHSLWTNADARAVAGPLGGPELAALLDSLQTAPPETAAALADGALAEGEVLLLAARRPAQRFAAGAVAGPSGGRAEAASAPVPSGGHTVPK